MGKSAAVWDQRSELEIARDWNGIEQVVLRVPRGASAKVSLHGGQVISWKNERGEELLFTSSKAIFKPPKAMRGGIPICFPQFGNCGSLEQHGFARNKVWSIDDDPPTLHSNDSNGKVFVDLLLKPMEDDLKCWPHCFEFRLRVSLSMDGNLTLISRIRNINGKPFSFSIAYHTYFSVSNISEVRVEGLETLDYLDNLCQRERFTEQGDAITFESEVDRIYLGTPNVVAVLDHEKKRTFVIRKEGLPDMVVWNPWEKKSKSMLDLGDDEYKQMLCVDAAAIERPITLKTGEEWTGRLEISAVPSSYCSDHFDQLLQGVM
ncbi:putative glucose-6-phosphate 1-epimerase isoform X1 [Dendrobium catenatum]|uniref:putative glucose-6-phosphate 1-epimerase isoform X1 n=1 Tax=Dendrobium catenatum TaxID=906689 RepID=UPI0009F4755D|nr:putative glucose-6-phosphate 1-epimerase isoform X1 [Dendrobium catenatum]